MTDNQIITKTVMVISPLGDTDSLSNIKGFSSLMNDPTEPRKTRSTVKNENVLNAIVEKEENTEYFTDTLSEGCTGSFTNIKDVSPYRNSKQADAPTKRTKCTVKNENVLNAIDVKVEHTDYISDTVSEGCIGNFTNIKDFSPISFKSLVGDPTEQRACAAKNGTVFNAIGIKGGNTDCFFNQECIDTSNVTTIKDCSPTRNDNRADSPTKRRTLTVINEINIESVVDNEVDNESDANDQTECKSDRSVTAIENKSEVKENKIKKRPAGINKYENENKKLRTSNKSTKKKGSRIRKSKRTNKKVIKTKRKSKTVCEICLTKFESNIRLVSHKKIVHAITPEVKYTCDVCNKGFPVKKHFLYHIACHDPERKMYTCRYCSKEFVTKHYCADHERLNHTGETPYACDICPAAFSTAKMLTKHMQRCHSDPYLCEDCGRSFPFEKNLIQHRSFHTGEKNFKCDFCEKAFRSNWNRLKHVKRRHEKRIPCDINGCDLVFDSKSELRKHKRTHLTRRFKCDKCDASFDQNTNLTKHKVLHSGLKPFTCGFCEYACAHRSNLNKHVKTAHPHSTWNTVKSPI